MEQGGGADGADTGGAGGTAPTETEGSAAPTAPQAAQPQGGTVPAATVAQDKGTDESGGGKTEPEQETALAAPEPRDGREAVLGEEVSAVQHDGGQAASDEGQAASTGQKVPAATEAQGVGKDEKDKPGKKKAPAAGELKGEKASTAAKAKDGGKDEPKEGKALAVTETQNGGKDKPKKEEAPGGSGAEGGGKTESTEEKALAPANSEEGKAKPMEETALAATQAQDGDKGEPAKKKITVVAKQEVPATTKALDEGKQDAKAEQAPADTKPAKEKTMAAGKEKAPNAAKAQSGENKMVKAEKATAVKKASDGGKEEPTKEKASASVKEKTPASVKEKATTPAKEKGPDAAKAQGGEKAAAKAEKTPAEKMAQAGGKKEPSKEKSSAAVKVQDGGKKTAKVEKSTVASKAGDEVKDPKKEKVPATAKVQDGGKKAAEEPLAHSPALSTRPHPAPTGLAGCLSSLHTREARGTQKWGPLDSRFPSQLILCLWADDVPPPPAPFAHRTVTLRSASVSSQFSLNSKDILGGGKFGEVHTCTEKETGLKLAAKVIRKQGAKDKEMVLLEIDVMNQLNHHNLIQLYDAIETPREIILFMEFVEGGELFERIIDDDYHLTEVDCMVFVRQICEGIRFMHHMCVLHLDLKPENILCVSATGHMVKIIDFGLARRYNPNEKLKVNFGTPEFLSPEVVNYEQVSYSTDMWSMGVITYMLLSGLSPFLGDDDTETLNNVLAANWYFDEETFESVSNEAKDFVSNLIIKDKSARMSADQCLQHPWLNNLAEKAKRSNRRLKSQVLLKKYVMRRRWKKNFIGVCAANRFRKITSSGSLTALGI
ncbi:MYLK2 kinase, partial [Pomatorhinus ruficollis]|nr:MYLK2 kinase [Pomatorhinus ruficollis]